MPTKYLSRAILLIALIASTGYAAGPLNIGNRLELFVDRYLIDRMDGTQLVLQEPKDEGIAIRFDEHWEGLFCGYATVIKDGDLYRAYYRGWPGLDAQVVSCVAESNDGIRWTKPRLGLVDVNGSSENNVILSGADIANFSPCLDTNPACSPVERYKAVAGGTSKNGMNGYTSPDGIRWTKLSKPVFNDRRELIPHQASAFWSDLEDQYVMYYSIYPGSKRYLARAVAKDFKDWSGRIDVTYSDTGTSTPSTQLYASQADPYFRAPHIYVSLPMRLMAGRRAISDEDEKMLDLAYFQAKDCSEPVLMTIRGGTVIDRTFLNALIRPGIGPRNWTSRTNFPARGVVRTGSNEMSIYVVQEYGK